MSAMGKERWKAIEPLLDVALELEGEERVAWLESLREREPAYASDIEALLRGESSRGGDLLDASPLAADAIVPALVGQIVGPYTLVEPIGDGGMGSVWRGRRSDGRFDGDVAIKLLHLSLVGRSGETRFAQEGQLLARLSHANIARMLDAGVTSTGQPYLVLEYIKGERIDRFVNARQMPPAERIKLFLHLCSAVSSAHAQLVLHRDIKPSNILVSEDGTAKLLDFGIAKLMDDGRELASESTLTVDFGQAFTPEFAAPEQLRGEPVSIATDVYALGIVLYVMLGGRHPTSDGCTTDAERRNAALTREPLRLSRRISVLTTEAPDDAKRIAAERSGSPAWLQAQYSGDLDNILAKALRKDPHERYQSVQAFADDLTAYLTDRPVSAQAESWMYRARKFVRRNRVAVTVGATVFITLLGASVVTTRQMFEAQRQRDAAAFEARYAQASNEFLTAVLTDYGPDAAPVSLLGLLDRAREAVLSQTQMDPRLRGRLMAEVADQYGRAGVYDVAAALMFGADSIAQRIADPELRAIVSCRIALGALNVADSATATSRLRDADEQLARITAPSPRAAGQCLIARAVFALAGEHNSTKADTLARNAAALLREGGMKDTQLYLLALEALAQSESFLGNDAGALATRNEVTASLTRQGRVRSTMLRVSLEQEAVLQDILGNNVAELQATLRAASLVSAARAAGASPKFTFRARGYALSNGAQYDSANVYLERYMRVADSIGDDIAALDARNFLVKNLTQQGRTDLARRRIAEMRAIVPRIRMANMRSRVIVADAQLSAAEGRPEAGLGALDSLLRAKGYPKKVRMLNGPSVVMQHADVALAARRWALADTSLTIVASAYGTTVADRLHNWRFGEAMLGRSRAAVGLGDTVAARVRLDSALAPLRFGLGEAHPRSREAAALRDSLRH